MAKTRTRVKPKKFKRAGTATPNKKDDCGMVKVQVVLVERGHRGPAPVKGNICRSVTLQNTRVSEVIAAIEERIVE